VRGALERYSSHSHLLVVVVTGGIVAGGIQSRCVSLRYIYTSELGAAQAFRACTRAQGMMLGWPRDLTGRPDASEAPLPREASGLPVAVGPVAPVLFVAFFCDSPRELPSRHSLGRLESVAIGRGRDRTARRDMPQGTLELTLPDAWTSARHAGLVRSGSSWHLEDRGSRNGVRVNGQLVGSVRLEDGDLIELGHTLLYFRQEGGPLLGHEGLDYFPLDAGEDRAGLLTLSSELSREMAKAWDLAGSELPLLIQGESGTGKEVLARALAERSHRRGLFVGVNCGA